MKIHGPKSKFIMKAVQVRKQEEFWKGGRRFLKLKKMVGDEGQGKERSNQWEANTWHKKSMYNSHQLDWNQERKNIKPLRNTKL